MFSAESAIQDASFSERASQASALRRASQPLDLSGGRYACNVAGSLTAQFAELEGPRFEYRPLFSLATERMVRMLFCEYLFDLLVGDSEGAFAHVADARNIDFRSRQHIYLVKFDLYVF